MPRKKDSPLKKAFRDDIGGDKRYKKPMSGAFAKDTGKHKKKK